MFNSIILGLVQGLTEFFPVSSSAHVLIFEKVLHAEGSGNTFAAGIHLATALAIVIYFHKEIWIMLKSFLPHAGIQNATSLTSSNPTENRQLVYKIILATIPVILIGFIVEKVDFFSNVADNLLLIGLSLIIFGILLYLVDKKSLQNYEILKKNVSYADSLLIGASQIIAAIFPGASRSGMTLTSSFFRGIHREYATKFIFLLAIPATALPGLYEIVIKKNLELNTNFFVAFFAAFVSGLFAIYFLLKLVQKNSLKWFCFYRIIFGVCVITFALLQ